MYIIEIVGSNKTLMLHSCNAIAAVMNYKIRLNNKLSAKCF